MRVMDNVAEVRAMSAGSRRGERRGEEHKSRDESYGQILMGHGDGLGASRR